MDINYFSKSFNKYFNKFIKFPHVAKLTAFFLIFILLPYIIYSHTGGQIESFNNDKTTYKNLTTLTGAQIYDDFYAKVYDDLLLCNEKNTFEISNIIKTTQLSPKSSVLDIGSGTGHHVSLFKEANFEAIGLDLSPAMVKRAKVNYPTETYVVGDAMNGSHFMPNKFSLITCLYFTMYYFKDKQQLLQNCIHWLQPGGYIVFHLVDKHKFDPILPPANPFIIVSPQKYADKRITTSEVKFDTHDYSSTFKLEDDNQGIMYESFKNKLDGSVRKHEHKLYFETQKEILNFARNVGFEFVTKIDMAKCQYENQFMYILKKPN